MASRSLEIRGKRNEVNDDDDDDDGVTVTGSKWKQNEVNDDDVIVTGNKRETKRGQP